MQRRSTAIGCLAPGCASIHRYGDGYCVQHRAHAAALTQKKKKGEETVSAFFDKISRSQVLSSTLVGKCRPVAGPDGVFRAPDLPLPPFADVAHGGTEKKMESLQQRARLVTTLLNLAYFHPTLGETRPLQSEPLIFPWLTSLNQAAWQIVDEAIENQDLITQSPALFEDTAAMLRAVLFDREGAAAAGLMVEGTGEEEEALGVHYDEDRWHTMDRCFRLLKALITCKIPDKVKQREAA
jgi:hypothetical protein